MWITTGWWKKQNNPQSSTLVLPPRAWGVVWWISQAAAGWSQPSGNRQCWSRAITAVLIAAGMSRLTPTSSGRLGPPRPARPPAQLLPPQERRQAARTRHQRDRRSDDGQLQAVTVIRILRTHGGLAGVIDGAGGVVRAAYGALSTAA